MAGTLQVDIVTPERSAFSGEAVEVVLPAWNGQLGVYPEHDAQLCLMHAGLCQVYTKDGVHRFVVGRGFADIGGTRVTLLTDACTPVAELDKPKAEKRLHAAEAEMAQHDGNSEKYRQARIGWELARAQLDA